MPPFSHTYLSSSATKFYSNTCAKRKPSRFAPVTHYVELGSATCLRLDCRCAPLTCTIVPHIPLIWSSYHIASRDARQAYTRSPLAPARALTPIERAPAAAPSGAGPRDAAYWRLDLIDKSPLFYSRAGVPAGPGQALRGGDGACAGPVRGAGALHQRGVQPVAGGAHLHRGAGGGQRGGGGHPLARTAQPPHPRRRHDSHAQEPPQPQAAARARRRGASQDQYSTTRT
eukprot:1195768-Prorocentrum_minimum.AAC.2